MDAVLLDDQRHVRLTRARQRPEDIAALLRSYRPDVAAIDSPPGPARTGSMRSGERELSRLGIHLFATPSDAAVLARPFYAWMAVGFEVFRQASEAGYPTYLGSGPVSGHALEVFPHASGVALAGHFPPSGWARSTSSKRAWRTAVLAGAGVDVSGLSTLDQVDAALAALSGLYALAGRVAVFGRPGEEALVVPDPWQDRLSHLVRTTPVPDA
jgi:predicted nuclease with RNAse H fold